MLLYIYFFQQLSEMGVIILPFHKGKHCGSGRWNYSPKQKSKLLRCGSFRIWTHVSNSEACGGMLSTMSQGLEEALQLALRPVASAGQPSGPIRIRWGRVEDLGVTGDVDQLCIWQWEGLVVRESSLCRIPGGMDQWEGSETRYCWAKGKVRALCSRMGCFKMKNACRQLLGVWLGWGLRMDGGNPTAGLTYLLDWAPSVVALKRESPPLFARLSRGLPRPGALQPSVPSPPHSGQLRHPAASEPSPRLHGHRRTSGGSCPAVS